MNSTLLEEYHWAESLQTYQDWGPSLGLILVLYLPMMFLLQASMKFLPAMSWKTPVFLWNLAMAIFSWGCFWVLGTTLIQWLWTSKIDQEPETWWKDDKTRFNHAFTISICTINHFRYSARHAHAMFWFNIMKFPEMVDTMWLALKKKPLTLLHLWHHLSVAAYTWTLATAPLYGNEGGIGSYFSVMNALVHGVMYTYYAVVSISSFRSSYVAQLITRLQILQMGVGLLLLAFRSATCPGQHPWEAYLGYLIYGSYMALFVRYYYGRYSKPKTA